MSDIVKVAGIVIRDGKMLMVKKYNQNFLGMLGGTVEEGESYIECLTREIPEEIGVTQFEIEEKEPFYTAYSVAGSDATKTLEIHCLKVQINEEPKPTYDSNDPEKIEAGFNISEIHWIGKSDLEILEVDGKVQCKLKADYKDNDGNILTLTPITEDFIFSEFIKLGIIN